MENKNFSTFKIQILSRNSELFLEFVRKINLNASIIVIFIGLIGNLLIKVVFLREKFRSNSSHIYLLCSAIVDNSFLITHFFEDSIRTYKDIYADNNTVLINFLNIVDKHNFICRLISYLRNLLRFISAYIVVAFTIQRLFIVYKPLSTSFKGKKTAWKTVLFVIIVASIVNIWVPFIFQINVIYYNNQYCDVNKKYKTEYFILNLFYICFVMIVPMAVIITCNILIIVKMKRSDSTRKQMQKIYTSKRKNTESFHKQSKRTSCNLVIQKNRSTIATSTNLKKIMKPHYWTQEQLLQKKNKNKQNASMKITVMLLVISFSFVALNIPYLFGWLIFFFKDAFNILDVTARSYLFAALQIAEIFYLINYGLKFFIYCITGTAFRNKLKSLSNKTFLNFDS